VDGAAAVCACVVVIMLAAPAAAIGEVTTPVVLSTGCMITGCAGGSDAGTCDNTEGRHTRMSG